MSTEKPVRFTFDNDFFEVATPPTSNTGKTVASATAGGTPPLPKNVREALEVGYAEGFAAAQTQADATYQSELAQLRAAVQSITSAFQNVISQTEGHLTRTTLTLLRASILRIIGHASENYPQQLLETHLKDLISHLSSHEEITLRIAPNARSFHEKLGLPHANIQGISFHIKEDTGLKPTDCVAEWRRGGVEAKLADHITRLDALLVAAGAQPLAIPEPTPSLAPDPLVLTSTTPPSAVVPSTQTSLADQLRAEDLVDALK